MHKLRDIIPLSGRIAHTCWESLLLKISENQIYFQFLHLLMVTLGVWQFVKPSPMVYRIGVGVGGVYLLQSLFLQLVTQIFMVSQSFFDP